MYMKTMTQARAVMFEVVSLDIANFICQPGNAFIMKGLVTVTQNYNSQ